jgi:hypothetical protein
MDNRRDSHYALSEEEEGGTMFSYLYRGISGDERADATMPIATNQRPLLLINTRRYWSLRSVATIFKKNRD